MIDPENSDTTKRLHAEALRHIKPDTLLAIQMREDGTDWAEIAEVIRAPHARAAEQRVRRAKQWMAQKFGSEWGEKYQKP